jgi:hypothetical protein
VSEQTGNASAVFPQPFEEVAVIKKSKLFASALMHKIMVRVTDTVTVRMADTVMDRVTGRVTYRVMDKLRDRVADRGSEKLV